MLQSLSKFSTPTNTPLNRKYQTNRPPEILAEVFKFMCVKADVLLLDNHIEKTTDLCGEDSDSDCDCDNEEEEFYHAETFHYAEYAVGSGLLNYSVER